MVDLLIILFSVVGSLIGYGLWIVGMRLADGVWPWN